MIVLIYSQVDADSSKSISGGGEERSHVKKFPTPQKKKNKGVKIIKENDVIIYILKS